MKRRERKSLKEELLYLLSTGDTQERLSLALIEKALRGDVRAFETIRNTIEEKALDKQEIKQTQFPPIIVASERDKQALEDI